MHTKVWGSWLHAYFWQEHREIKYAKDTTRKLLAGNLPLKVDMSNKYLPTEQNAGSNVPNPWWRSPTLVSRTNWPTDSQDKRLQRNLVDTIYFSSADLADQIHAKVQFGNSSLVALHFSSADLADVSPKIVATAMTCKGAATKRRLLLFEGDFYYLLRATWRCNPQKSQHRRLWSRFLPWFCLR